jgi:hypothetical protein
MGGGPAAADGNCTSCGEAMHGARDGSIGHETPVTKPVAQAPPEVSPGLRHFQEK